MELWTGALSWWKCHWPDYRVLASSDGISSWTPLKPQHSNPNPNPLANQLWCIDSLTHPTLLIIPYRLPAFLESLMMLDSYLSIPFFHLSIYQSIWLHCRLGMLNTPTASLLRGKPQTSVLDMTLNHRLLRLHFWIIGKCRVLFIAITSISTLSQSCRIC